jgi:hypothetical protein
VKCLKKDYQTRKSSEIHFGQTIIKHSDYHFGLGLKFITGDDNQKKLDRKTNRIRKTTTGKAKLGHASFG